MVVQGVLVGYHCKKGFVEVDTSDGSVYYYFTDKSECTTKHERPRIACTILINKYKKVKDKSGDIYDPELLIEEYAIIPLRMDTNKKNNREIVAVKEVGPHWLEVVGRSFPAPTLIAVEDTTDINKHDFVCGRVQEIPSIYIPQIYEDRIFYKKLGTRVLRSQDPSAKLSKIFVMTHVRSLTMEEKCVLMKRGAGLALDRYAIRFGILDSALAVELLECSLEQNEALDCTDFFNGKYQQVRNSDTDEVEHYIQVWPTYEQYQKVILTDGRYSWRLGSDMIIFNPSLCNIKNEQVPIMAVIDKLQVTNTCYVRLKIIARSRDIFTWSERVGFKLGDTFRVGPMTRTFDHIYQNLVDNFKGFVGTKVFSSLYDYHQEEAPPLTLKEKLFMINGVPLDQSQLVAMETAAKTEGVTVIEAPPGCGKTFLIAALVKYRHMEDPSTKPKRIIIAAKTNVAVTNALDTIKMCFPEIKIARDFSARAQYDLKDELSKEISLLKIAAEDDDLDPDAQFNILEARANMEMAEKKFSQAKGLHEGMDGHKDVITAEKDLKKSYRLAADIFVVGSTSELLIRGEVDETISHLIIDEASQMSPTAALTLYCKYPNLTHITLLGDPKQLGPYTALTEGSMAGDFVRQGELPRMLFMPKVTVCRLKYIYRCHPKLVNLLLRPIYGDHLRSGITEEDRNLSVEKELPVALDGTPCLFVHIDKGFEEKCINMTEIKVLKQMLFTMKEKEIAADDIVVICHHRAQQSKLVDELQKDEDLAVYHSTIVHTVDSFQGKEAKIVFVLTTKTVKDEKYLLQTLQFVSNKNRETVAVSRSQHALYILGDIRHLIQTHFWGQFAKNMVKSKAIVNVKMEHIHYAPFLNHVYDD